MRIKRKRSILFLNLLAVRLILSVAGFRAGLMNRRAAMDSGSNGGEGQIFSATRKPSSDEVALDGR